MSAPTPAPGDDRPREGYYPDPSIPGYVRYWNGAAWVPGTSRPAPADGEPLGPPPGVRTTAVPAVEETGPHFFDEDPVADPGPAAAPQGGRPEPASAWGADRSRQSGFGGEQDRRVSWGAPAPADPRVAHTADPAPADAEQARDEGRSDGTFVFRRPTAGGTPGTPGGAAPGVPGPGTPVDEGTMTFRTVPPRAPVAGAPGLPGQGSPASGPASGSGRPGSSGGAHSPGGTGPAGPAGAPAAGGPAASGAGGPGFGAGKAAAARAAAAQAPGQAGSRAGAASAQASAPAPAPAAPAVSSAPSPPLQAAGPQGPGASTATPLTSGAGGGQSSWAQQVHQLAGSGEQQPVAPWKPPVEDPFQAAARRQAAARPAGLGKRLTARLVDSVVLGGVTAVAAVPLGAKAIDHVNDKIEEAKLSGRTVTVWLLDGTTGTYLAVVLAVLLLFGVVYEVLPTAKWGRTLGKKLCGLEVRDIEGHEPPSFGPALRRWLVWSVPGLLGIGLVGMAWCLFDRPWRQCWHDKAAHTFVAG
ncbi:RDD family protein [Streptomyces sp. NPDC001292]|uniref:RDD family protein n=1 Tax=Streptomyces sp. NPDC001292 TaxID=3364558 RepID=UPI0036A6F1BD